MNSAGGGQAAVAKDISQAVAPSVSANVPRADPLFENEIRRQLDRILTSRYFARSERLCRFLRFSVEQLLAGTGEQVKEQLIGIEVFDRAPDYDPRIDPIVRVEARRLRSKLMAFYASLGATDPVRIEFPKGTYVPTVQLR